MARLYLVRHGRAITGWESEEPDPGLDEVGRAQAEARAAELVSRGPAPILSSPLRRARETAAALERRWDLSARIDPRIGEVPTPANTPVERVVWLRDILQRSWSDLGEPLARWRSGVVEAFLGITQNTVVFSHFVAINVVVGHALGSDRVTCFRPDNCSCSVLEVHEGRLQVVELGVEGNSSNRVL